MSFFLGIFASILWILLLLQIRQRQQLHSWLEKPGGEIPDGIGVWRDLFSKLHQLRREERKERLALCGQLGHFRKAAQAMPNGVILLDENNRIDWINTVACCHFGLDASRDIGSKIEHLVRQRKFYEYLGNFRLGTVQEPLILSREAYHSTRILSIVIVSFDKTDAMILSNDKTEIIQSERAQKDFVANVSHELRTPLTVVYGFLEQMLEDHSQVENTFLPLMIGQAKRMSRLVEDLLTLSRLENSSSPLRDDVVDISGMIETLRSEAEVLSNGLHTIEVEKIEPIRIQGNAEELRSAFGNLISNAIRYTPDGGVITLSWKMDENCPNFSVVDTGIGILPEHISRLTERFYRVDKSRSSATGGTGLGLAIVKQVLVRHQGKLEIESEIGRGSVFSAKFPSDRIIKI
ncbi:sensor histidine kinase PhoR [Gammaproteobacteria bacterium]